MSEEPKPLSDMHIEWCKKNEKELSLLEREMLATIRDRDARIASLESQVRTLEHWINSQNINTEARRAEAVALYNSFIARGWGDGDKAAFASRAEAAIEAAGVFDETWEKRNQSDRQADEMAEAWIAWEDLQRDHDALRAELEAAKTKIRFQEIDLDCVRKERDTGYSMAEAAKKRIAELTERREKGESAQSLRVELKSAKDRIAELENTIADLALYKAGIEALPVEYHVVRKTVHGTFETMNEYTVKRGRFIPAEEE